MRTIPHFINKHAIKLLYALTLGMGVIIFFTLENGHVIGGDFAQYIEQSEAILSGHTADLLESNTYAMDHSDRNIGPYLYPVGFPLLITPVTWLFGVNFIAYKTLMLFFFLLVCITSFYLFRTCFDEPLWPLIIALSILFNYYFMVSLDLIGSDIPYLFFALMSLYLIKKHRRSNKWLHQLGIGMIISFAFLLRTSGVSILFTLGFIHFYEDIKLFAGDPGSYLRGNYRRFLPYIVFIIAIILDGTFYYSGEQNHIRLLQNASVSQAIDNLIHYATEFKLFLILYYPEISVLFLILSTPFLVIGIIRNLKHNLLFLVFIAANFGIYAIWPEQERVRFLFPVLPFYFYFLVKGILIVSASAPRFKLHLLPYFLLLGIMIQGLFYSFRDFHQDNSSNVLSPASTEVFNFITTKTDPSALFIFTKPRTLRLMTGRNAIAQSETSGMLNSEASFVLKFREPMLEINGFELIFSNKDFELYRINHALNPQPVFPE